MGETKKTRCPYKNKMHIGCCFRNMDDNCEALANVHFYDDVCHFYKTERKGANIYDSRKEKFYKAIEQIESGVIADA